MNCSNRFKTWQVWVAIVTSNNCVSRMNKLHLPSPSLMTCRCQDRDAAVKILKAKYFVRTYCIVEQSIVLISMTPNCVLHCGWPCHILTPFAGVEQVRISPNGYLAHLLFPKQKQLLPTNLCLKISVTPFTIA